MSQRPGRNGAHCPGWPLQPQRCFASRCAGRACGAPLTLETSASPAGLTARARPEARPEERAANLHKLTGPEHIPDTWPETAHHSLLRARVTFASQSFAMSHAPLLLPVRSLSSTTARPSV